MKTWMATGLATIFLSLTGSAASALDKFVIASGAFGNWQTAPPHMGKVSGIFAKHGLDVEVLWTEGGGESLQAVASSSADVGVGLGLSAVMAAFQRGAPIRPIGNTSTGPDLYWYVPANSPIKSLKDADGKTIAYATIGSSGYVALLQMAKRYNVNLKLTATGGPAATLTQVMSGQVDIGWANPPFGFEQRKAGLIRVVALESELPDFVDQTSRVLIANINTIKNKSKQMEAFRAAYAETIEWMYSGPEAMKAYSDFSKVPLDIAHQVIEEFWPKKAILMTSLGGVDAAMRDAVDMKLMKEPLSKTEQAEFFAYYAK
jgi:NitT/TauT family transport system substrate-binding protein